MTQVYDPTAPSPQATHNLRYSMGDLRGKVVGFIDNSKPNFNLLIDDLAGLLTARYGVKTIVKSGKRSASMPAAAQVLDDLAAQCDLVITGSGDWGSCTSWSVHDSVEIARRGRAAVTVVSNAFIGLGKAQARALGHPHLPLAVIPHPFGSRTRDEVRALAEPCVAEIAKLAAAK